jgi:hypothetical protein
MKIRVIQVCLGLTFWWALAEVGSAQDSRTAHPAADTNNAVIEGRVTLPSGFSADRNIRITLKNAQSVLNTFYSNKHGEFQIRNLSEGTYYVHAEVDDVNYEPVVEQIMLGRGIVWTLTLQLREKPSRLAMSMGARVISAAEARQPVPVQCL